MTRMSEYEFNALRSGDKTEDDVKTDRKDKVEADYKESLNVRDLLLGRSKKTTVVHLDECDIEIRTNLSRKSIKDIRFLNLWSEVMSGDKNTDILDSPEGIESLAEFLTFITVDPELNKEFWMAEELDTSISQMVLQEFLTSGAEEGERVRSFRTHRDR